MSLSLQNFMRLQRLRCRLKDSWNYSARLHSHRGIAASSTHQGGDQLVLGIESSCDDTGVALVSAAGTILAEEVASQVNIHSAWGGVVPKLAQEAHEHVIDDCVDRVLAAAGVSPRDLAAIAVTIGPGLSLCLRVGALKARSLAATHAVPIIPVHHMEAHALVARLDNQHVRFPFLCLLVSGGHNLLLIVEGVGKYVQLGTTLDDALGEAYDKVARLLGLDLRPSGGAALEWLARSGNPRAFPFTVPLQKRRTCDFSYAGLKTAVRLAVEERIGAVERPLLSQSEDPDGYAVRADIAASFQAVAVRHLEDRCRRALEWAQESHPDVRHLVVAGGVASNAYLRHKLGAVMAAAGVELVCPPPRLCTDNGVMVAWAGLERLRLMAGVEAPPPLESEDAATWVDVRPRWPLTDRCDVRAFQAPRSAKKKNISASLEKLMNEPTPE